jgi:hypothetical protein
MRGHSRQKKRPQVAKLAIKPKRLARGLLSSGFDAIPSTETFGPALSEDLGADPLRNDILRAFLVDSKISRSATRLPSTCLRAAADARHLLVSVPQFGAATAGYDRPSGLTAESESQVETLRRD